jgi:hypothetical protein
MDEQADSDTKVIGLAHDPKALPAVQILRDQPRGVVVKCGANTRFNGTFPSAFGGGFPRLSHRDIQ